MSKPSPDINSRPPPPLPVTSTKPIPPSEVSAPPVPPKIPGLFDSSAEQSNANSLSDGVKPGPKPPWGIQSWKRKLGMVDQQHSDGAGPSLSTTTPDSMATGTSASPGPTGVKRHGGGPRLTNSAVTPQSKIC